VRLAASLLLALVALASAARAAEPFDPFRLAGIDPPQDARAPMDAGFRDQAGRPTTLRSLGKGRAILLAPVQHRCPNLCQTTLDGLARALLQARLRPGRDVEVVALGIDPREGPAEAAVTAARLRAALRTTVGVHALVGGDAAATVGPLGYRFAWDPRIGQYAHVAAVAALAPDGRLASWIYGVQPPAAVVAAAVGAARGGPPAFGDRLLLLCYHFDPAAGRYGLLVESLLRFGGALTAAAIAAGVGLALWRERRRGRAAA
jgi:protein SCO1/2